jgi:hypothetical protein
VSPRSRSYRWGQCWICCKIWETEEELIKCESSHKMSAAALSIEMSERPAMWEEADLI